MQGYDRGMARRRQSWTTRLRWRVEAALFDIFRVVVRRLPAPARLAIGDIVGSLVWLAAPRLRTRAVGNIRRAFGPSMAPRQASRLARRSMCHFARLGFESLALDDSRPLPAVEGLHHLQSAMDRGLGVVGVSAHFGHWELLRWATGR